MSTPSITILAALRTTMRNYDERANELGRSPGARLASQSDAADVRELIGLFVNDRVSITITDDSRVPSGSESVRKAAGQSATYVRKRASKGFGSEYIRAIESEA